MDFSCLSAEPGDCRRLKDQSVHATRRIGKLGKSSKFIDSVIERRQGSQNQMDSDASGDGAFFDICSVKTYVKSLSSIQLETPSHLKNKEKMLNCGAHYINVLRPGMLHLRRYISVADQVKIVEICRKLGLGSGGFYQPGYRNGGKLNLKMMYLGKSWDPQRFGYGDVRPTDGAKPPSIPDEFLKLVERALQDSHAYLKKLNNANLEDMLPSMNPDICIVNFYSESGRLGLHQDKEESKESLMRGLPVVSISIGDSAEFVYGDDRKNVEKVVLESGDVLIFGGCSRHIYHGVTTIFGETTPQILLRKSNLRPGRLNLTFRQY
ncbi:DNA metabolism protein [Lithospermum erythrorhizon]|uniref:DNA metabolism protein n=1 Tax=Lithospermum erythrorhizon TaxID=34254 RepID=A0AAV3PEE1_LITER